MKNENKDHYRRRIKLILVDHFYNKGIPYDRQCDVHDSDEETKEEAGALGIKRDASAGELPVMDGSI